MIELFGDVLSFAIPLFTLYNSQNNVKFIIIYCTTMLIVFTLKRTTNIERPNKKDKLSFPSGHMASVYISSIYYLNEKKSNILLPFAFITGYSRIYSKNHTIYDILGSVVLSHIVSYFL